MLWKLTAEVGITFLMETQTISESWRGFGSCLGGAFGGQAGHQGFPERTKPAPAILDVWVLSAIVAISSANRGNQRVFSHPSRFTSLRSDSQHAPVPPTTSCMM